MTTAGLFAMWIAVVGPPPPPEPTDERVDASDDAAPGEPTDVAPQEPSGAADVPPPIATPGGEEAAPAQPARAPSRDDRDGPWQPRSQWLTISGYVQPQYSFRVRSNARARDRNESGAGNTRAGIVFAGEPVRRWSYTIHLVVGARIVDTITRVDAVDDNGDGNVDDIAARSEPVPGLFIEELTVKYRPVDVVRARAPKASTSVARLDFKLGQLRIPFSAQGRTFNPALMFTRRSAPNDVFLFGTDLGALAQLGVLDDKLELSTGVFNGTGLAVSRSNERGALVSGRIDVNPLGGFPFSEGDLERGKFRFGVGAGLLYFPSRIYDDAGNDTRTRARDLRMTGSLRLAVRGFYLQGEYLRRQRTDSLSSRPLIADGAYGQTSVFVPIGDKLGLAPMGRFGWTTTDRRIDPRTVYYGEAGVALYLASRDRPDGLRVLAQYVGENRVTEHEVAHGAAVQLQLRF